MFGSNSGSQAGWSKYRAKRRGISIKGKCGKDGGGKVVRKRKVWWEMNGKKVAV